MVQERIDDWWEYAKDLARAERELQIERWVYISIEYKDEAGTLGKPDSASDNEVCANIEW